MKRRPPPIQYALTETGRLAFQRFHGGGSETIVFVPGFVSNIDQVWAEPHYVMFLESLARFMSIVLYDKAGMGLSDRTWSDTPTIQGRVRDLAAVLDAAGGEPVWLFAWSEGGPLSLFFAHENPERVKGIVLFGTAPRFTNTADYTDGISADVFELFLEALGEEWGTGIALRLFAPSVADDPEFQLWWASYQRNGASPSAVAASLRLHSDVDARPILASIHCPVLVLHCTDDIVVPIEAAEHLATGLPNARLVCVEGSDHAFWVGNSDTIAATIIEFITGARPAAGLHRVRATVLFTDIVASTRRLAQLGDRQWGGLLDDHGNHVRALAAKYSPYRLNSTGDGFAARFDSAAHAIRCAHEIIEDAHRHGFDIRVGINTGEAEVSRTDLVGLTVHVAARVCNHAPPNRILVTAATCADAKQAGFTFTFAGDYELRGVPGRHQLYYPA